MFIAILPKPPCPRNRDMSEHFAEISIFRSFGGAIRWLNGEPHRAIRAIIAAHQDGRHNRNPNNDKPKRNLDVPHVLAASCWQPDDLA